MLAAMFQVSGRRMSAVPDRPDELPDAGPAPGGEAARRRCRAPWPRADGVNVYRPESHLEPRMPFVPQVIKRADPAAKLRALLAGPGRRQCFWPDPDEHGIGVVWSQGLRSRIGPGQIDMLAAEVDDDPLAGHQPDRRPGQTDRRRAQERRGAVKAVAGSW